VIGAPPKYAATLKNWPGCDQQVLKIAAEIWGDLDGKTRTERKFGKGRIVWGKTPREVLLADGVQPDFTFTGQANQPETFDYIHRTSGDTEIYYVINRTNRSESNEFTFRVSGKQPEIFDPVTGETRLANAFRQAGGCTTLPLELDRFGSVFIVFRKAIATDLAGKSQNNSPRLTELNKLDGPWNVSFDPTWGGPAKAEFTTLESWTLRIEEGIRFYSGKATYRKTFDLNPDAKPERIFLDLGNVRNVAEVRLNGQKLGILWCAPWRVEITGVEKPTGNQLEIDVINLWANRVVGDLSLPKEKRYTVTHDAFRFDMLKANTPLLESGLLGPVRIMAVTSGGV
jgi:hypothetical protein